MEKLLSENLKLSRQNNKMLKKIHHTMVLGRVVKAVYWVIIIGSAFGLYFFMQPYIDGLQGYVDNVKVFFENPRSIITNTIK